jgi:hypothetical protein
LKRLFFKIEVDAAIIEIVIANFCNELQEGFVVEGDG